MSEKIFVIGFSKCGTTSLNRYFKENGLKTLHYFNIYEEIIEMENKTFIKTFRRQPRRDEFIGLVMKDNYLHNRPLFTGIKDFDVITQMDFSGGLSNTWGFFPQINLLEEIIKEYPNAKYIFNERDVAKWYNSLVKWYRIHLYYSRSNIPGLNGSSFLDFKNLFETHKQNVITLFTELGKLDKLLIYNIEMDDVSKLNRFTGLNRVIELPNLNQNRKNR